MASVPSLDDLVELLRRFGQAHIRDIEELRREVVKLQAEKNALELALTNHNAPGVVSADDPLEVSSQHSHQSHVSFCSKSTLGPCHEDGFDKDKVEARRVSAIGSPDIQLASVWQAEAMVVRQKTGPTLSRKLTKASLAWIAEKDKELAIQEREEFEQNLRGSRGFARFIAVPGGRKRLAWDLFGGFLILFDLVGIPLKTFNPPAHWFTDFIDWVTLLFWTANIGMTLTVGYSEKGRLVMSPWKIFIHYLKTWCVIDVLVVLPDWIFTFVAMTMSDSDNSADSVKLLRVLRLARTIRLLRLLKLKWILDLINDLLDSESASIVVNICKMVMLLLAINHFIACGWFAVGTLSQEGGLPSWIVKHNYQSADWNYQYITSFHWSITQFTPSSMDIQPHNIYERTFSIFVVVFALVGFSYVVGSITGSLTQLRNMSEHATKEFWKLRRFLRKNQVTQSLAFRIKKFTEHAHKRQKNVMSVQSVAMLQLLSDQLSRELHYELNIGNLDIHPLFQAMKSETLPCLQRLCVQAISYKNLAPQEVVFLPGAPCGYMYFPKAGTLSYALNNGFGPPLPEKLVRAGEAWLAEAALWTLDWTFLGLLTALQETELLLLGAQAFAETVKQDTEAMLFAREYAVGFLKLMKSAGSSISDLMVEEDSDKVKRIVPSSEQKPSETEVVQVRLARKATFSGM
eukprot:TRINITY_DN26833_c0_g1_i1.p1 TRINITY_DN26833_c0_g1~~TRINITY_DN26833_c0_g1_i1.p1  ORF type:complete len:694 (-),score=122.21 TRINITY_DN26833_c0_g1_i1:138-2195(-)